MTLNSVFCNGTTNIKYNSSLSCNEVNHLFTHPSHKCVNEESLLYCVTLKEKLNKNQLLKEMAGKWTEEAETYGYIYNFHEDGTFKLLSKGINDKDEDAVLSGIGYFELIGKKAYFSYRANDSSYQRAFPVSKLTCAIEYSSYNDDYSKARYIGIRIIIESPNGEHSESLWRDLDHPEISHEVVLFE